MLIHAHDRSMNNSVAWIIMVEREAIKELEGKVCGGKRTKECEWPSFIHGHVSKVYNGSVTKALHSYCLLVKFFHEVTQNGHP